MSRWPPWARAALALGGATLTATAAVVLLLGLPLWRASRSPEARGGRADSGPAAVGPVAAPGFRADGREFQLPRGFTVVQPSFHLDRAPAHPPDSGGGIREEVTLTLRAVRVDPGGEREEGRFRALLRKGRPFLFTVRTAPGTPEARWLDVELMLAEARSDFLTIETSLLYPSASAGNPPQKDDEALLLFPGDTGRLEGFAAPTGAQLRFSIEPEWLLPAAGPSGAPPGSAR